jgi:dihydroorotase
VGQGLAAQADVTIDATGKHVMPGFIDPHCHLRDPGQTHKEDIVTGTRAAAKGGYTTVVAMPNTEPVVDSIATVEYIQRKAAELGSCKVLVVGALTKKSEGKEISEVASMIKGGIVAVSDDGHCVQEARLMFNACKYVSGFDLPVIVHAEDYSLAGRGQINGGKVATQIGLSGIPGLAEEIIIDRDIMIAREGQGAPAHRAHQHAARHSAGADGAAGRCEGYRRGYPHHLLLPKKPAWALIRIPR